MTDAITEADEASGSAAAVSSPVEGHTGAHAMAVAAAHGVDAMFTLSGAHVFPMYDGDVRADPPMRTVAAAHEQPALFAAEAVRRPHRSPLFPLLTAFRSFKTVVSAITQVIFSG